MKAIQPGAGANIQRIIKAIEGERSPSGRKYNYPDEAAALVGFRVSTFDPKIALSYRAQEYTGLLRDASGLFNKLFRNLNEVDDDTLQDAVRKVRRARSLAFKEMLDLIHAAEKGGANRSEIFRVLKKSGVGNKNITALRRGKEIKPWKPSAKSMLDTVNKSRVLHEPEVTQRLRDRRRMVMSMR